MNYIVLEGASLYLFLALIILLVLVAVGCLICAILTDKRNYILGSLLSKENHKVKILHKENFILKLKSGEIDINEE